MSNWFRGEDGNKLDLFLEFLDSCLLYTSCGYHEALTMLYGDYMTPPPPGDRELVHCDPKFVTLSYSEKGEKNS